MCVPRPLIPLYNPLHITPPIYPCLSPSVHNLRSGYAHGSWRCSWRTDHPSSDHPSSIPIRLSPSSFFIPTKPMHLRMPIDIEREKKMYTERRVSIERQTQRGTCVFVRVGVCAYVGMCVWQSLGSLRFDVRASHAWRASTVARAYHKTNRLSATKIFLKKTLWV